MRLELMKLRRRRSSKISESELRSSYVYKKGNTVHPTHEAVRYPRTPSRKHHFLHASLRSGQQREKGAVLIPLLRKKALANKINMKKDSKSLNRAVLESKNQNDAILLV